MPTSSFSAIASFAAIAAAGSHARMGATHLCVTVGRKSKKQSLT